MTATGDRARSARRVGARFADIDAARVAIARLERAGVAGSAISLEGDAAEQAADEPDTAAADQRFMDVAAKATIGGALLGGGFGAVVAALGGLLLGLTGVPLAMAAAAGLVAGGGLGFFLTPIVQVQESEAYEQTLHPVEGSVEVVVLATEEAIFSTARDVLAEAEPEELSVDGRKDG